MNSNHLQKMSVHGIHTSSDLVEILSIVHMHHKPKYLKLRSKSLGSGIKPKNIFLNDCIPSIKTVVWASIMNFPLIGLNQLNAAENNVAFGGTFLTPIAKSKNQKK